MQQALKYAVLTLSMCTLPAVALDAEVTKLLAEEDKLFRGGQAGLTQPVLDKAREAVNKSTPDASAERAAALEAVGEGYLDCGYFAKAGDALKEAYELRKKLLGATNVDTAISLDCLSASQAMQNKQAEAEAGFKSAQAALEKSPGDPKHYHLAICLGHLGGMYAQQKQYAKAAPILVRSCQLFESNGYSMDPHYATSSMNLGATLLRLKQLPEAEKRLLTAERIYERTYRSTNPLFRASMHNMTVLFQAEVDAALAQSDDVYRKEVGKPMFNLASSMKAEGNYTGAAKIYDMALKINSRLLPANHPTLLVMQREYQHCLSRIKH